MQQICPVAVGRSAGGTPAANCQSQSHSAGVPDVTPSGTCHWVGGIELVTSRTSGLLTPSQLPARGRSSGLGHLSVIVAAPVGVIWPAAIVRPVCTTQVRLDRETYTPPPGAPDAP